MANWIDFVKEAETIALFSHINSDGDANGSVMAMKYVLESLNKKVYVFVPLPISESFHFIGINNYSGKGSLKCYDLAIALDAPNTKRFGNFEDEFFKAKKSISIDHHMDNEHYADITILESEISSTCELLFKLFSQEKIKITPKIATCLYLGIATDTGGFMYGFHGALTAETWNRIAELARIGADMESVNYNIFGRLRKPVFEIMRKGLNKVELFADGKIAMCCVNKKILEETGAEVNDTHKLTNIVGSIDGVDITVIMTQNSYREQFVSVRSKKHSAQRICKYFGGGGHLKAAGCRIFEPFLKAKELLLEECIRELNRND